MNRFQLTKLTNLACKLSLQSSKLAGKRLSLGSVRFYATPTHIHYTAQPQAQQCLDHGNELMLNGQTEFALNWYLKSIDIMPTATAHYNAGLCYYQLKNIQSTLEHFEKSLELDPNASDVHTNLANLYVLSLNQPDKAIFHLQQAVKIDPMDGEAHYNLGCVLDLSGQLELAMDSYKTSQSLGVEKASSVLKNAQIRWFNLQKAKNENKSD